MLTYIQHCLLPFHDVESYSMNVNSYIYCTQYIVIVFTDALISHGFHSKNIYYTVSSTHSIKLYYCYKHALSASSDSKVFVI